MDPLCNTMDEVQNALGIQKASASTNPQASEDYTITGPLDPPNVYDNVVANRKNKTKRSFSCMCLGQNLLFWLVVITACVIALLAVLLVVLVIVQAIPVCNCAASTEEIQALRMITEKLSAAQNGTSAGILSLRQQLDTLNVTPVVEAAIAERITTDGICTQQIQALRMITEKLSAAQNGTSANISSLRQQLDTLNVTPVVEAAIAERITTDGTIIGLNFSARLESFEPYSDCQTRVERTCDITASIFRCETADLPYILTGNNLNYTRDAHCIRMPGSTDQNIMSTALTIDEESNIIYCLCYRQTVGNNIVADITCGLQVTRCRSSRAIPVSVVTTSDATSGN